jgi:hypothetical protein
LSRAAWYSCPAGTAPYSDRSLWPLTGPRPIKHDQLNWPGLASSPADPGQRGGSAGDLEPHNWLICVGASARCEAAIVRINRRSEIVRANFNISAYHVTRSRGALNELAIAHLDRGPCGDCRLQNDLSRLARLSPGR